MTRKERLSHLLPLIFVGGAVSADYKAEISC